MIVHDTFRFLSLITFLALLTTSKWGHPDQDVQVSAVRIVGIDWEGYM
jgi:hypothetical protein